MKNRSIISDKIKKLATLSKLPIFRYEMDIFFEQFMIIPDYFFELDSIDISDYKSLLNVSVEPMISSRMTLNHR